jgi:hypothetical protein
MIRESLAANAANAYIGVTPGNGVTWQDRSSTAGGTTYNNTTGLSAPYWVKLLRSGGTFTGYRSPDGVTWTQQGTATFSVASTIFVGLALTSHDSANLANAIFDNVTAPGWPNAAPPAAPASLAAVAGNALASLTWPASSNASSYNVKRANASGGPYTIASNVTTTNYTDSGLINGTTYYYVISALNLAGESANNVQASTTPEAPATITVSLVGTNLLFSWPVAPAGFALQSVTNLAFGNWQTVTSPVPQMIGAQWQMTLPLDGNSVSTLYRLLK